MSWGRLHEFSPVMGKSRRCHNYFILEPGLEPEHANGLGRIRNGIEVPSTDRGALAVSQPAWMTRAFGSNTMRLPLQ